MVVVSYSGREINAKLVYYGTGLSGKTTNLEHIYGAIPATSRGKMVSMKTQNDRTLFFDLLPVDLGEISGFKTRFMLYTVPGQVFYNATRKLVLRGADAVVFVADSERGKMDENRESLQNLVDNLREYNLSLDQIPWVIQYNKRDLPEVYTVDELNRELNPKGVPSFEGVAINGNGVFETFRGVSRLLLENLSKELKLSPRGAAAASGKGNILGESFNAPANPTAATFSDVRMSAPSAPPREVSLEAESAAFSASSAESRGVAGQAPPFESAVAPAIPDRAPTGAAASHAGAAISQDLVGSVPASVENAGYSMAPPPLPEFSDEGRTAPSLAERFSSWWKSGKKPEGEPMMPDMAPVASSPASPSAYAPIMSPPETPRPQSPVAAGPEASPRVQAESATQVMSLPESLAPSLSGPAPKPPAQDPAAAAPVPAAAFITSMAPPPAFAAPRPVESEPVMKIPDFTQGFNESRLPETIPAAPSAKSVLARPEPVEAYRTLESPASSPPAQSSGAPVTHRVEATLEKTVRIPVSLEGLKPGQKVKIHLVVEVEAVGE